jgi:cytochrome P450
VTSTLDDFVYDPFAPDVMANPLPFYEVMREHFPVYYAEKYDTFFLSRFEDVWEFLTLTGNEFTASEGVVFTPGEISHRNDGPVPDPPTDPMGMFVRYSSPTSDRVRQAHGKPLRPGSVRKLEPLIRENVRARLDVLLPRHRFNLVEDFGGAVAASTMCSIFRIPLDRAEELHQVSNEFSRTDHDSPGFNRSPEVLDRLVGFVIPNIAERRAAGPDGSWPLIDGMLELRVDGRLLTDREIAVNLLPVLVGGSETVPKILGHGVMELWRHPDQLAAVRADPQANSAAAVEEMVRFCGPAQWFGRTCRVETVVGGRVIQPGQRVAYLTQAANRDPREFDDPEEFRWNRPIPRTVGFGRGQHFCMGTHLARLELRLMLEEFLTCVASYDIDVANAVRRPSNFQWGYSDIPVVIRALADVTA